VRISLSCRGVNGSAISTELPELLKLLLGSFKFRGEFGQLRLEVTGGLSGPTAFRLVLPARLLRRCQLGLEN